jgi:hypothetical protein
MKATAAFILALSFAALTSHAGLPSAADHDVYRGAVSFRNFGAHMIGVLVVDERAQAGGYVHLFRLWTETTLEPIHVEAPTAIIEFRGRELVILIPEERRFFTFVLPDAQFSAPRAPAGFTGAEYIGYGLNHDVRVVAPKSRGVASRICDETIVDCFIENPD